MFLRPLLRIVPDDTRIQFMRGRFLGLLTSAVLSVASVILFFYPGLHLGIDFRGGVVMEVRTPGPADFAGLRGALAAAGIGEAGVQRFGAEDQVAIRLEPPGDEAGTQALVARVRTALELGQGAPQVRSAASRLSGEDGLGTAARLVDAMAQ